MAKKKFDRLRDKKAQYGLCDPLREQVQHDLAVAEAALQRAEEQVAAARAARDPVVERLTWATEVRRRARERNVALPGVPFADAATAASLTANAARVHQIFEELQALQISTAAR